MKEYTRRTSQWGSRIAERGCGLEAEVSQWAAEDSAESSNQAVCSRGLKELEWVVIWKELSGVFSSACAGVFGCSFGF